MFCKLFCGLSSIGGSSKVIEEVKVQQDSKRSEANMRFFRSPGKKQVLCLTSFLRHIQKLPKMHRERGKGFKVLP
jgi:hypothetical protein